MSQPAHPPPPATHRSDPRHLREPAPPHSPPHHPIHTLPFPPPPPPLPPPPGLSRESLKQHIIGKAVTFLLHSHLMVDLR